MSDYSNVIKNQKFIRPAADLVFTVFLLGAVTAGSAHGANAVVAWLNQPVAAVAAVQASAPAAQHPCAASDLQIFLGQKGAHRGYATQEIRLTNHGADQCFLTGFPGTQLMPSSEAPQALAAHDLVPQLATDRVDLAPGDDAILLIGAPGSCDAAIGPQRKVTTRLQLALPGGGSKVLDGAHVDTLCGRASVLRFEAVHNDAAPTAKSLAVGGAQLDRLTGTLNAPDQANRGTTLHYTVTLANPTGATISFAVCPSYTQSLYADGKVTSATLRLNCGATGAQIAANASVTYEMLLPLPADLAAGGAKLSWTLRGGPTAGTLTTLR